MYPGHSKENANCSEIRAYQITTNFYSPLPFPFPFPFRIPFSASVPVPLPIPDPFPVPFPQTGHAFVFTSSPKRTTCHGHLKTQCLCFLLPLQTLPRRCESVSRSVVGPSIHVRAFSVVRWRNTVHRMDQLQAVLQTAQHLPGITQTVVPPARQVGHLTPGICRCQLGASLV